MNTSDDILGLGAWALDLVDVSYRRPRITASAVSRHDVVRLLDTYTGARG